MTGKKVSPMRTEPLKRIAVNSFDPDLMGQDIAAGALLLNAWSELVELMNVLALRSLPASRQV